jgi:hypothetical protein
MSSGYDASPLIRVLAPSPNKRSASVVILDEAAHFIDAGGPRTGSRVWAALRPVTTIYGSHARTLVLSTPSGDDFFTTLYARAEGGELGSDARSFRSGTADMNLGVASEFLEGERLILGEADYRREYLAEFAAASSAFFTEDDLRGCVGRYQTLEPSEGEGWVLGLDPSFSADPSGIAIVGHAKGDRKRLLVALTERWQPRRSRTERRRAKTEAERAEVQAVVLDRVAELSRQYGRAPVVSDSHLAAVIKEELRARGVERVVITAWNTRTLTEAFRGIRARVLADSISFPDDPELIGEMLRVRTRTRSGQPAIELSRSAANHCDQVAALAAAVLRLETKGAVPVARTYSSFAGRRGLVSDAELEELMSRPAVWGLR